jgi:hypothetical protein
MDVYNAECTYNLSSGAAGITIQIIKTREDVN